MEQVIFGGSSHNFYTLNEYDDSYNSLVGGAAWQAIEFWARKVVSTAGKIKNLRVKLEWAPGAGTSWVFTLLLNGAPTALTFTIADAATSGANMVNEIDVVAGDTVSLKCHPTGAFPPWPAGGNATWTSVFEGSTEKESLILGGTYADELSKTVTEYTQVMGAGSEACLSNVENDFRQVCPTAGTIKKLYVEMDGAPGGDGSYRFTLRKGGVSQTLTVTITDPATTGNDVINSFAVAAGDILTMMIEPLDTPAWEQNANWGMTFLADTDKESIVMAGTYDNLNPDATEYAALQASTIDVWIGDESQSYHGGQVCTLKKLYILLSAAPGDGKSYTFTLRKGDAMADGTLTVTIIGAAVVTGNDVIHTDAIANDDYVDLKCVPANTPNAADAYWGLVCDTTIPPPPPDVGMGAKSPILELLLAGAL